MARSRTSSPAELLVTLRRDDPEPLHQQLEQELRASIRSGRLTPGSSLPSTRVLAEQLGLSRGVVVESYEQLIAEGYLVSQPGGATRVCSTIGGRPIEPAPVAPKPAPRIDFAYGRPDVSQFPRDAWLRALRRVLNEAPNARLGYIGGAGIPELREELATYLNRVRGTCAEADHVVVCGGFAQALDLVTRVLRDRGARRLAVEDPGQTDAPRAARRNGLEAVPVPVDDRGLVVDALASSDADAVVLTPAHHFPTGGVLSAERRTALVAWAVDRDALILEDDYDAEYRYDREPIGAIHGLAPDHVVYAGSASKTLAPGLRLGWLIVPGHLVESVTATKEAMDRGSASLEQLAFADFLARGEFDHHLRRMRPVYRRRRDVLLRTMRRLLPELEPAGASAGLHVAAWLPAWIDEAALVERSAALGVAVNGVTQYWCDRSQARGGLLFGYGTLGEPEIEEGMAIVAQALEELRAGQAQSDASPRGEYAGAATDRARSTTYRRIRPTRP